MAAVCHTANVKRGLALVACLSSLAALACRGDDGTARAATASAVVRPVESVTASDATPASSAAPGASGEPSAAAESDDASWLARAMRAADPRFEAWLAEAEELRLQVLVTVVEPGAPVWKTYAYRADAEYFYPASTIKLFLAVAALRAMSELAGGEIDPGTRIRRCRAHRPGCEPPDADAEKTEDGEAGAAPSDGEDAPKKHEKLYVGEELHKLLAYSDNDSYNRFWDIVGHRELNETMLGLGFASVRFHHRMDAPAERSRDTLRVLLSPPRGRGLQVKARHSELLLAPTPAGRLDVGRAYRGGRGTVDEPMSFAEKNYASLHDLHRALLSLLFPERPEAAALGLGEAQRKLLVRAMTAHLPGSPKAAAHHPLAPGVLDVLPLERVRYVGKAGKAYGFQLENAYVEDLESHRGMLVTATIYANPNGVLNDDDYAYEELSAPLLRALGVALARAVFAP